MSGDLRIPDSLDWVRRTAEGRAWLADLPDRLAACAENWSLRVGPPFPYAFASLALPAELPDGTPAVLKLQYPDGESEHEATALACWAGDGAVRLLRHDPHRRALLVERCVPGTPLHEQPPDAALDAAVALLPRLCVPAGAPFTPSPRRPPAGPNGCRSPGSGPAGRTSGGCWTPPSGSSPTWYPPRASRCWSTRTCTPVTCSAPPASRGSSSTRSR